MDHISQFGFFRHVACGVGEYPCEIGNPNLSVWEVKKVMCGQPLHYDNMMDAIKARASIASVCLSCGRPMIFVNHRQKRLRSEVESSSDEKESGENSEEDSDSFIVSDSGPEEDSEYFPSDDEY